MVQQRNAAHDIALNPYGGDNTTTHAETNWHAHERKRLSANASSHLCNVAGEFRRGYPRSQALLAAWAAQPHTRPCNCTTQCDLAHETGWKRDQGVGRMVGDKSSSAQGRTGNSNSAQEGSGSQLTQQSQTQAIGQNCKSRLRSEGSHSPLRKFQKLSAHAMCRTGSADGGLWLSSLPAESHPHASRSYQESRRKQPQKGASCAERNG